MLKCCNNALNCVCQMNKRPCIGRHLSAEGGAKISDSDRSRNSNERYAAYCPGYSMKVAESIEWVCGCNWAHCAGENNGLAWRTAGCLVVRWSGGDLAVTATGTLTMDMCLSSATPPTHLHSPQARDLVCVCAGHAYVIQIQLYSDPFTGSFRAKYGIILYTFCIRFPRVFLLWCNIIFYL